MNKLQKCIKGMQILDELSSSDNPSELVRVAHQHWDRIGWPEDAKPIALLERAIAILDGSEATMFQPCQSERTEAGEV